MKTQTNETKQSAKWTREPWGLDVPDVVVSVRGRFIASFDGAAEPHGMPTEEDDAETEANAARTIACVNACAGMPDPSAEIARLRAKCEAQEKALDCIADNAERAADNYSTIYGLRDELRGVAESARAVLAL